jgi:hypothetical protein
MLNRLKDVFESFQKHEVRYIAPEAARSRQDPIKKSF